MKDSASCHLFLALVSAGANKQRPSCAPKTARTAPPETFADQGRAAGAVGRQVLQRAVASQRKGRVDSLRQHYPAANSVRRECSPPRRVAVLRS